MVDRGVSDGKASVVFVVFDDAHLADAQRCSLASCGTVLPQSALDEVVKEKVDSENFRRIILVTENFSSEVFWKFRKRYTILSPWALDHFLPRLTHDPSAKCGGRPVYNLSMGKVTAVFTGIKKGEEGELENLVHLVHNMGGEVREKLSGPITHVISSDVQAEKYQPAVTLGTPVMTKEWVTKMWELRDEHLDATSPEIVAKHRMKPFFGLRIYLTEFEDPSSAKSVIESQDGIVVEKPEEASYIVLEDIKGGQWKVDGVENPSTGGPPSVKISFHKEFDETNEGEAEIEPLCFLLKKDAVILRSEWLWMSVKIDNCANPRSYAYDISGSCFSSSRSADRKRKTPASGRKRSPRTSRPHLSVVEESSSARHGNASFDMSDDSLSSPYPFPLASAPSARQRVVTELYETEKNYHTILGGILDILDKATDDDQSGGRLLGALEDAALMQQYVAKIQNMRDVHKSILTELEHMVTEWVENCEVGRIFVRNSQQLEAAYPPFVNTFARLLAFIDACEKKYPRFQAHLKLCEKQREYGREHIKSILIRPVQRLGSILLLLKELSKQSLKANENDKRAAHQREVNPDIACLAEAAKEVDRVLQMINEKKRATEVQELLESIDGAPEDLMAGHRTYVAHLECTELCDKQFRNRGTFLTLLLLTDSLEVAKIRPDHGISLSTGKVKGPLKYLRSVPLSKIKLVLDVLESEEVNGAFAFKGILSDSPMIQSFKFAMTTKEPLRKREFLAKVAAQISITTCATGPEELLKKVAAADLGIKSAGLSGSERGLKRRTSMKTILNRVTSFGKSSGKKVMKRAMSSMLSLTPTNKHAAFDSELSDGEAISPRPRQKPPPREF